MPGRAGAIRAGRAFVELFADSSKLVKGLRVASAKLKGFGNDVRALRFFTHNCRRCQLLSWFVLILDSSWLTQEAQRMMIYMPCMKKTVKGLCWKVFPSL